jgi:hypothetical protein
MKTGTTIALIVSTLAVLSVGPTASFAQNFVAYSSAYGKATTVDEIAPVADGITALDRGYQGAWRQHRSRTDRR